jgi:hypothetical protein
MVLKEGLKLLLAGLRWDRWELCRQRASCGAALFDKYYRRGELRGDFDYADRGRFACLLHSSSPRREGGPDGHQDYSACKQNAKVNEEAHLMRRQQPASVDSTSILL